MNNKLSLAFFLLLNSLLLSQTVLRNEKVEGRKLILKFSSSVNYRIEKQKGKNVFVVPDYQNESAPGDVKLPSHSLFISLPFVQNPNIKYSKLFTQNLKAIPEFNYNVEIKNKELVYSESNEIRNSKLKHFEVKGYLWIGDKYCLHLEVTPAIFLASRNSIEFVKDFQIELNFTENIRQNSLMKKTNNPNEIICNTPFTLSKKLLSTEDTWIDYSKKYVKIGTAEDGVYRITKPDLEQLGINVTSINPKTFKMFLRGKEIPVFVKGENDLRFDNSDFIEFAGMKNMGGHHRELSGYGEPYNEYLGRYTDTTVYWLTWNGSNGKRVTVSSGNEITSNEVLDYYSQIDHYEKNNWFDFSSSNQVEREKPFWIENKTWHEGGLKVRVNNKRFSVNNVVPGKTFKMFAKFQDYASNISTNAHYVTLGLNSGNWGDSVYFNKYEKIVLQNELSTDLLNNGNNYLSINSMQTQATLNVCIFDWYEIEYPRYLIATNDSLKFLFPFIQNSAVKKIKLQNVNSDNFVIWKYGNKYKKITAERIGTEITFTDTITNKDKFIYVDESKILSPKYYYLKQFVNLRSPDNQTDYIAITHKKFKQKVSEYIQFIASTYNIRTAMIDIDDIYDEFGYGFFNPEVIRDFLKTAHTNWRNPKPQYVFLIGGATYDYYGYKHKNFGIKRVLNYVPSFGAPVSDNWFVTWDTTGAYIPQMNIGRIPVTTNEELDWYIEKHKNYVTQKYDDWNKRYLFFSGGDENKVTELTALKQANQYVIDNYVIPAPVGGKAEHFYKTVEPLTNFGPYSKDYVQNAIDEGGVFISYLGHSGTQTWDNSIIAPRQLMNKRNRYPIVSDFGCSTGKFAEPDVTSFSELFTLSASGQALAYIGNSSLGFLSTSLLMPKLFYKKILNENIHIVSEAHKQAKIEMLKTNGSSGIYQLSALTNLYFGDPILTLPIPTKPNLVIKENAFELSGGLITDLADSTQIKITYNNYGSVSDDYITVEILHQFGNKIDTIKVKRKMPDFIDSLFIKIKTKGASGQHSLQVILDPQNKYSEIYENDNSAQFTFYVFSSSIRPMLATQYLNGVKDQIDFVNSSSRPTDETIVLELATDKNFTDRKIYEIKFDTVRSTFYLNNLENNKRYFGRTKIKGDNNYSAVFSFITKGEKYYLADSLSFNETELENLYESNNKLSIDTTKIKFEVLSAGFSDGNTALILKNSKNYVANGTIRGHYISVFNDSTYEFEQSLFFDLLGGGTTVTQNYISFLDTISSTKILCFAIKDDGAINLTTELRNKIKEFGSIYIDSVKFRSSWAFIGKKGALPGSMPEAFTNEGEGKAAVDTTISFLSKKGKLLTSEIGPAARWKKLIVNQELPSGSMITYTPIGIKQNGTQDTLAQLSVENSEIDLSGIDAKVYPKLKILADFISSSDKQSPILSSFGIDYGLPAELATNYQVVSVKQDSVEQGNNVELSFYVYNIGEAEAKNFDIKVDVVKNDNTKETIFNQNINTLAAGGKKQFNVSYNTTSFNGSRSFTISIDSENKITELYEDNNYYSIPFFVKGDTTKPLIDIKFNGNELFDGEYVSSSPEIKIEMSEPSLVPISDTSAITIFLNNKLISYKENADILNITYSPTNPKVVVNYTPTLEDGEYKLKVFGRDAGGNLADSAGVARTFIVESKPKLMNVYNYPNPMTNETYFTFKLTQIPDEVKIRIFTIAGRMIKEIKLNSSELNFDLNKIYWDGKDTDGDEIANGTYLYKIIMSINGKHFVETKKLAIIK